MITSKIHDCEEVINATQGQKIGNFVKVVDIQSLMNLVEGEVRIPIQVGEEKQDSE